MKEGGGNLYKLLALTAVLLTACGGAAIIPEEETLEDIPFEPLTEGGQMHPSNVYFDWIKPYNIDEVNASFLNVFHGETIAYTDNIWNQEQIDSMGEELLSLRDFISNGQIITLGGEEVDILTPNEYANERDFEGSGYSEEDLEFFRNVPLSMKFLQTWTSNERGLENSYMFIREEFQVLDTEYISFLEQRINEDGSLDLVYDIISPNFDNGIPEIVVESDKVYYLNIDFNGNRNIGVTDINELNPQIYLFIENTKVFFDAWNNSGFFGPNA